MPSLGVPYEYEAVITDGLTGETITMLPWSKIKWQRARNKVSQAEAFVAIADGGMSVMREAPPRPWNTLLSIQRNGSVVWDGPVTSWSRPSRSGPGQPPGFTIRAHDRLALLMRRLVGADITATSRSSMGTLFRDLLVSGDLGGANDPYTFVLPSQSDFMNTFSFNSAGTEFSYASIAADREYRVARLERLFDVISELAELGLITFTQAADKMWVNEVTLRNLLGGGGSRPVLSEATTLAVPGVEGDALGMSNKVYAGTQSQGKAGFPTVADCTFFASTYVQGTLESGYASSRSGQTDEASATYSSPLSVAAAGEAARSAAPSVTIERTPLAPSFGCPAMDVTLSNLVPGIIVDVDYAESVAFDVPVVSVNPEYRYWYTASIFGVPPTPEQRFAYMFTPVSSDEIRLARLEQLDVGVDSTDGPIVETVDASFTPYAEWDGTVPPNWPVDRPPRGPNLYLE